MLVKNMSVAVLAALLLIAFGGAHSQLAAARMPAMQVQQKDTSEQNQDQKESAIVITLTPESSPRRQPGQFKSGEDVVIKVGLTNTSTEPITISYTNPFLHHLPRLFKDGQPVPFLKEADKKARSAAEDDSIPLHVIYLTLEPNKTEFLEVYLSKWYGQLQPGKYELRLQHRFRKNGPVLESDAVNFEVIP
jgi:hypothetical protein